MKIKKHKHASEAFIYIRKKAHEDISTGVVGLAVEISCLALLNLFLSWTDRKYRLYNTCLPSFYLIEQRNRG